MSPYKGGGGRAGNNLIDLFTIMERRASYPPSSPAPEASLLLSILFTRLSLSSGRVYVRRGSNITDCSLKCPHREGVLELYKECGREETHLLELWCNTGWHSNRFEPRIHLDPSSGCWTLTDARTDDSCVYNVVHYGGNLQTSLSIRVLDPVLISNITSNSSRTRTSILLGQNIAVSVQFTGEEAAVTWDVVGGRLPDRYRLIDDNRTMIIPSAQRDDTGRRLRVRITNPISEETREYRLEITDVHRSRLPLGASVALVVSVALGVFVLLVFLRRKMMSKKTKSLDAEMKGYRAQEDGHSGDDGAPQEPLPLKPMGPPPRSSSI
ncbi:uncharacterized protein [Engystomops pustulosus]|uniref:uncharacterized protein n=1 Tax=Engystomops pustulosus TaxID=76066 RepID=UPI003AFA42B9